MIIERIVSETGLSSNYVKTFARTASHRYKVYSIRKRSGGTRTICHPARELKFFQTGLTTNVFNLLPIHPAARAYRSGSNIRENAANHLKQNFLLKVDFRDFFPSIRGRDIIATLRLNSDVLNDFLTSEEDYEFIKMIVCRGDSLTIGAPSSPILSNAVMFRFDEHWAERSGQAGVVYSRYADDLGFSTSNPNILSQIFLDLRADIAGRNAPRLEINVNKIVFCSRKRKRLITGLVLTSDKRISLGRARKRQIKTLVFRHGTGQLTPDEAVYLRGFISYARSVEPTFVDALKRRYGKEAIKSI